MAPKARRSLVPALRFPEFRDAGEWEEVYGNNLFKQVNDRNHEQDLPVLAITQENGAIPRDLINYHVVVTEKSIENYKVVQIGDFIISLRSFQGGIEYSSYHGISSPAYVVLRRLIEGSDIYFKHYFKTERFISLLTKNLEGLRDGKMISYRQFSELLLSVPKPSEQQKIADCLSSIDDLITLEARKIEVLKAHKKGLMQQLFPADGETIPKLRFPEFRDAGEWEEKNADTLFANRIEDGEEGLPIYSVTMNGGMVKRSCLERKIDDITKSSGNKKALKYDIVYNMMRMWQGAFGVSKEDCMVSPAYVVLSPQRGVCSDFFGYLFKLPKYLHLLTSHSQGLTLDRLRLYYKDFVRIRVFVPSLSEQQKIADCLSSLDDLIALQAQKLESLKAHKKGLMQQLFPVLDEVGR